MPAEKTRLYLIETGGAARVVAGPGAPAIKARAQPWCPTPLNVYEAGPYNRMCRRRLERVLADHYEHLQGGWYRTGGWPHDARGARMAYAAAALYAPARSRMATLLRTAGALPAANIRAYLSAYDEHKLPLGLPPEVVALLRERAELGQKHERRQ